MTVTSARSAALGGALGAAVTILAAWIAGSAAGYLPYAVLLVVGVALVGLVLGATIAAWAYAGAAVTLLAIAALAGDSLRAAPGDLVRLLIFMVGAPLIVFLILRLELARRRVVDELAVTDSAEREAAAERERSDAARRELDHALAAAERERRRLQEVAEAIPEPLIVYDDQLHGTYGNRAALRLFGRSFVERAVEDWGRVALPRDEHGQPLEREAWPQVRAQAAAFKSRMTLRVPMSGRDVMVDVEGTPVPGGGCVLLLRDVGKEEDERRRLSRFASFVAHELRNPLAVAKARTELAHRDPRLGKRAEAHMMRALESVDAAIAILERLELYSRAESGRVETKRERFALAPAVGAAVERLRARGSDRQIKIDVPKELAVVGDRHLSEQAINNLLSNADRYSTLATPITVEAEGGEVVTLRVRDEGPGIPEDVADRLFRDRVAGGRGLGLGLYLVHVTMTAMGGSAELEARRPGATFALRWQPAAAEAADTDGASEDGAATAAHEGDAQVTEAAGGDDGDERDDAEEEPTRVAATAEDPTEVAPRARRRRSA